MALLDPKERVLDVILTDYGRELLAQNRLNFTYYAFSDEGIDYSGSIATKNFTGSIDQMVFRNFSFEENQKSTKQNLDLKNFLYTVPTKTSKIPEFVISPTTGSTITLVRHFYKENFSTQNSNFTFYSRPLDVIFRATVPTENREAQYVKFQNYVKIVSGTM
jgi:hypothetical protein